MFHTPQEHNPKNVSKNINTFQSKSKTIAPLCQRHLRFVSTNDKEMYLHKSSTSIKICLKVFNLSILSKLVINVIFLSFLMDVCYKQNPSFYRCKILQMPCLITRACARAFSLLCDAIFSICSKNMGKMHISHC